MSKKSGQPIEQFPVRRRRRLLRSVLLLLLLLFDLFFNSTSGANKYTINYTVASRTYGVLLHMIHSRFHPYINKHFFSSSCCKKWSYFSLLLSMAGSFYIRTYSNFDFASQQMYVRTNFSQTAAVVFFCLFHLKWRGENNEFSFTWNPNASTLPLFLPDFLALCLFSYFLATTLTTTNCTTLAHKNNNVNKFHACKADGPGPTVLDDVKKKEERLTDKSRIRDINEEWGSIQKERMEQETRRMSGRKTLRKKGWRLRRKWNSRARQLWFPARKRKQFMRMYAYVG